jgi:hypothetical protein
MDKRIVAEAERDRPVGYRRQRNSIIQEKLKMGELRSGGIDSFFRYIDTHIMAGELLQVSSPPAESGRNLENRVGWQKPANPRKQMSPPNLI